MASRFTLDSKYFQNISNEVSDQEPSYDDKNQQQLISYQYSTFQEFIENVSNQNDQDKCESKISQETQKCLQNSNNCKNDYYRCSDSIPEPKMKKITQKYRFVVKMIVWIVFSIILAFIIIPRLGKHKSIHLQAGNKSGNVYIPQTKTAENAEKQENNKINQKGIINQISSVKQYYSLNQIKRENQNSQKSQSNIGQKIQDQKSKQFNDNQNKNETKEILQKKKQFQTKNGQRQNIQKHSNSISFFNSISTSVSPLDQQTKQINVPQKQSVSISPPPQPSLTTKQSPYSTSTNVQNPLKTVQQPIKPPLTCQQYILDQQYQYGRLYTFQTSFKQFRRNSDAEYFVQQPVTQITQEKYAQAIDLAYLTHYVDQKGNFNVKDTPCQNADQFTKIMAQRMSEQYKRFNDTYQIELYHKHQLGFCIVVNSFNNARSGLLYRNLDSILQQNYTNYHVVYTDDASYDNTGQVAKQYLKSKNFPDQKFKVIINTERVGMMANIYNAITNECQLGEIAVMLDGDDSFIGTNVLVLLNAVYQKEKLAMMWTNFIEITFNSRVVPGFSRSYGQYEEYAGHYRAKRRFFSSHLKTFFVDLFRKIKIQDLKLQNGKFFGGISDVAIMFPMIQMSFPRWKYIPQVTYEYRFDTGQQGMIMNKEAQILAGNKISRSKMYERLNDFTFIDKAIEQANNSKN